MGKLINHCKGYYTVHKHLQMQSLFFCHFETFFSRSRSFFFIGNCTDFALTQQNTKTPQIFANSAKNIHKPKMNNAITNNNVGSAQQDMR